MSSKAICIRETLYSAIRSVSAVSWLFARSPGRDFTRNVKLPFAKLITLILSLKGSSITCELMEHFGCTKTLVSEPAFVKRRSHLLPEALETIFRLFVESTCPSNRYKGFRLLAVDGSDLHTPTNPDDTASFIPGPAGQEPYNLQHLNALYDLCSHIYMDAIVQGRHQYINTMSAAPSAIWWTGPMPHPLLSSSLTEVMSPITSLPIFREKVGNS